MLGTGVLLLGVLATSIRYRVRGAALAGVALLWAGGVSNLFDRLVRGSVVDFMNVGIGPVRTGIFNVADMAIMAGCALLLLKTSTRAAPGDDAPAPPEKAADA